MTFKPHMQFMKVIDFNNKKKPFYAISYSLEENHITGCPLPEDKDERLDEIYRRISPKLNGRKVEIDILKPSKDYIEAGLTNMSMGLKIHLKNKLERKFKKEGKNIEFNIK